MGSYFCCSCNDDDDTYQIKSSSSEAHYPAMHATVPYYYQYISPIDESTFSSEAEEYGSPVWRYL